MRPLHSSAVLLTLLATLPCAAETPPAPPPVVLVTHAVAPPAGGETLLPGTIEAWQETQIHARTAGYVRQWHVDIGDVVKAGDLLVEIDTPELDQSLAAARAAVAQAEANQALAKVNLDRWRILVARKTVPEYELDERDATFKARSADLLAAQANRQRYEEMVAFKRVTSPFAGTVTRRLVERGALVDAGAGGNHELYRVAETGRLRLRVGVPQALLRAIKPGLMATVLVAEFPGQRFSGKVVRTAGAIEPASRTLLTEIELPNADGTLLPGLYAQASFKLPQAAESVVVPTNTVRFDAAGAHVVTVDEARKIRVLNVELGRNLGTQYEVLHGLPAKTAVVLNPTDLLVEGLQVEAREPPTPGK